MQQRGVKSLLALFANSPTHRAPDALPFADNEQPATLFEMSKKSGKVAKDLEEQTYEIREIVLAKIRGFPPWPAQVRLPF